MSYFVYLIKTKKKINNKFFSYVGYTNDLSKRLQLHNNGKGAKYTKGKKWELIYYEKYESKNEAMINEYTLKKNYKLRKKIKNKVYIKNIDLNS
jgi:putative endonuclease